MPRACALKAHLRVALSASSGGQFPVAWVAAERLLARRAAHDQARDNGRQLLLHDYAPLVELALERHHRGLQHDFELLLRERHRGGHGPARANVSKRERRDTVSLIRVGSVSRAPWPYSLVYRRSGGLNLHPHEERAHRALRRAPRLRAGSRVRRGGGAPSRARATSKERGEKELYSGGSRSRERQQARIHRGAVPHPWAAPPPRPSEVLGLGSQTDY